MAISNIHICQAAAAEGKDEASRLSIDNLYHPVTRGHAIDGSLDSMSLLAHEIEGGRA
jgi:hypothetical protein